MSKRLNIQHLIILLDSMALDIRARWLWYWAARTYI